MYVIRTTGNGNNNELVGRIHTAQYITPQVEGWWEKQRFQLGEGNKVVSAR